ncbi:hypothetical protein BKA56DRAFT_610908 [Ilyonectria sp. MPI-CAGE-AT-0026]|nr:hypothetical protein BKA56DRAFT_610908 [Ilyonectria sp. MPI-CAGE-AT-0026]
MTTFDDIPDAPESSGSHTAHSETRDELRHLVNQSMRHSQAKAATAQAMEHAERASELTRPLEALAARVEVANHRLESLPAIIHQIVKQTAIDASTDQLQTITEAPGNPDETSIAEHVKTLNAAVATCLDTVFAGPHELPTHQEVDRHLGTVDGSLNKQRGIVETEVEVGVNRTVPSVAEKFNAAAGDVKREVIDSANDIKESAASMSDMSSGVKSEETLAEKRARLRAVLIAVRRHVDYALEPYDFEVTDATTSQVKKRVESMQQIVDAYLTHLATVPGNRDKGVSTLTANDLLSKTFGAMKNEVELLGKLVPEIVDMQGKANAQTRRIFVLEEDVKTLSNVISGKGLENKRPQLIDQITQSQDNIIAAMRVTVDMQDKFIVNLQRTVAAQDILIGNLRGKLDSQAKAVAGCLNRLQS